MESADIAVVVGTRPELIKMAPVVRRLGERSWNIHSGQHYDDQLVGAHYRSLRLSPPDLVLEGVGGLPRGRQIGKMLEALTDEFERRRPNAVLVQGDTNTVAAAAQAGAYLEIPVVHIEAGLRSYDRAMPEEANRILTGALAAVHCAPTEASANNLLREGVPADSVMVTGNTIVEATQDALADAVGSGTRFFGETLTEPYALATIHRPENTDDPAALARVLRGLAAIDIPVLFLIHPRTRAAVRRFGLEVLLQPLIVRDAPSHREFLDLARRAAVLVSDSGGVQEECTVLKVPLVVVRRSTERPESIDAGFAWLAGPDDDLAVMTNDVLRHPSLRGRLAATSSPFGDGRAAERIEQIALALAGGAAPAEAIAAAGTLPHAAAA